MSLSEHLRNTQDFFTYVVTYIGGFPEEDQITPQRALTDLATAVEVALARSRNSIAKHWLSLCLKKVSAAKAELETAHPFEMEKHLEAARSFFNNAVGQRKISPDFFIGPDGQVGMPPE